MRKTEPDNPKKQSPLLPTYRRKSDRVPNGTSSPPDNQEEVTVAEIYNCTAIELFIDDERTTESAVEQPKNTIYRTPNEAQQTMEFFMT